MPDFGNFEAFHFLRPRWLWALLPVFLFYLLLRRRIDPERQWRRVIAPHLLMHLKLSPGRRTRFRPIHLTVAVLVIGVLGLAGPTWQREVSPFAEDTAPLVIALDVSASMNAVDVQPSRLERAKQKIRDLLTLRPGARTALIAYAGTAHAVLPFSDDPSLFEAFLADLSIDVMPVPGKNPVAALVLAGELLARDSVPGSILFLTDGIAADYTPDFAAHTEGSEDEVMVLAVGTTDGGPIRTGPNQFATDAQGRRVLATLDREGLEALAREADVFVGGVTVDDADVSRIQRRVQSHLRLVQQEDPTARWRDFGYFLIYPLVGLALLWFRRGWTVRWGLALFVLALTGCGSGPAGGFRFMDLWLTPDQQGRRLFEQGQYAEAGGRFEDFMWQGVSYYRAGDLEQAILAFARLDTPEAHFDLGNAYARLGSYEEAVASYETALRLRPGWTEASENRDRVLALIPAPPEGEDPQEQTGPPTFDADEVQFDEQGEQGERGEVDMSLLGEEQLTEMWMRRLQTSPADFLRRRFAEEARERGGAEGER